MSADIFTKPFLEIGKWMNALELINICDFSKITITPSLWKWKGVDPNAKHETKVDELAKPTEAYAESSSENGAIGQGTVKAPKKKRKKTSKAKGKRVQITETSAPMTVCDSTECESSQESSWTSDEDWIYISDVDYKAAPRRKRWGNDGFKRTREGINEQARIRKSALATEYAAMAATSHGHFFVGFAYNIPEKFQTNTRPGPHIYSGELPFIDMSVREEKARQNAVKMLDDRDSLKQRWVQMINPHQLQVAQLPVVRPGLTTKIDKSAMRSLKQCIDKLEWLQQGRPTTIGEGKCLGITSLPEGGDCEYAHDGAITSCKDEHIELIRLINATLLAAYGHKQFC